MLRIKWLVWLKFLEMNDIQDKVRFLARKLIYSETPILDAYYFYKACPNADEYQEEAFIIRRNAHEPVSKILGRKGFWTLELLVSQDVLDPRPDSETLVEAVLSEWKDKTAPLRILDIGTGSGCLLLALLSEYPSAIGIGVDKSQKAIDIAIKNTQLLGLSERASFTCQDMQKPDWYGDMGSFDIIVSNPPYIPTADIDTLSKEVREYEPMMALDGGRDGLLFYRILAHQLSCKTHRNSRIYLEIGKDQETEVIEMMKSAGWDFITSYRDMGHIVRVLVFQYKG